MLLRRALAVPKPYVPLVLGGGRLWVRVGSMPAGASNESVNASCSVRGERHACVRAVAMPRGGADTLFDETP